MVRRARYITSLILPATVGLLLYACDSNPADSRDRQVPLQIVIDVTGSSPQGDSRFSPFIPNRTGKNQPPANSNQAPKLSKAITIDEARVMVLDMTQWENIDSFFEAWYEAEQFSLLDTTLWDDERDDWDNIIAIFKSYTGGFFQFAGDYNLALDEGVAKGTVTAQPGLNYFWLVLREAGITQWDWELSYIVKADTINVLCFGCPDAGPAVEIMSPADGSTFETNVITVSGTIGDTSISIATLIVNGSAQTIAVQGGFFTNAAVLSSGSNTIRVEATNETGTGSDQITVTYTGAAVALRATLIWDTDDTDMDLHMFNPSGEECYFGNATVGGMNLDVDDTFGYGPENITVTAPITGDYIIQVVNFDGPDGYGTTVTVEVFKDGVLFETRSHQFSSADIGDTWEVGSYSLVGGGGGPAGVNATVSAIAVSGNDAYVGGFFTTAGSVSADQIARWDGSSWYALGSGADNFVGAIAVSGSDVYIGGPFATAGGLTVNRIARWDGSSWSSLGSGMDGQVYAIGVNGNDVYVGGDFTTAGGVTGNYIARWDGSSWYALGSGTNVWVWAIAVSGSGDVYVGGPFATAGGLTVNRIARWDGSSWYALGSGLSGNVRAIAVSGGGDVYVGGDFTTADGVIVNYIARWNGSSWSSLGSGMDGQVNAIGVNGNDVYVGGDFTMAGGVTVNYIARWDGSSWHALGSGTNDWVWAIAVSGGGDVYVGGPFTTAGGVTVNNIARWDGSQWNALGGN